MLDRKDLPALLLIAPTGGGKTLAGFLPTLTELADGAGSKTALVIHPQPKRNVSAQTRPIFC